MDQGAACRAAAGGHADVLRSRVFGCNIKCLARENVKRSRRQTKRKERLEWTDRREGKKVPPLRAEKHGTTSTRFSGVDKVRVCILAERRQLRLARIMRRGGPIRPRRLVDTCRHGTPREGFSRVRPGKIVARHIRCVRTDDRRFRDGSTQRLQLRNQGEGNSNKSTLRNAECAFHH
jgi:hypothetical protein